LSSNNRSSWHHDEISRAKVVGLSVEHERYLSLLYEESLIENGMMMFCDMSGRSET
jgi:hypothetical protein